ncbi:hypothetical protein [Streptomyces pinistramenti]|nr:hypothetical protein [Streptomyces pinistramenti]MCB5910414.1 hypothetical protein [Streptomyces pinistramenti]
MKGVTDFRGVCALTWAPNARPTSYGAERRCGARHIVWRRAGTHNIVSGA